LSSPKLRKIRLLYKTAGARMDPKILDTAHKSPSKDELINEIINEMNILFRIICRIGKKSRKNKSLNHVWKEYHNAMYIGMHKVVIKKQKPNCVHKLMPTMPENLFC
jgi:hypothetical protein